MPKYGLGSCTKSHARSERSQAGFGKVTVLLYLRSRSWRVGQPSPSTGSGGRSHCNGRAFLSRSLRLASQTLCDRLKTRNEEDCVRVAHWLAHAQERANRRATPAEDDVALVLIHHHELPCAPRHSQGSAAMPVRGRY